VKEDLAGYLDGEGEDWVGYEIYGFLNGVFLVGQAALSLHLQSVFRILRRVPIRHSLMDFASDLRKLVLNLDET
jgi:hypothetical protein